MLKLLGMLIDGMMFLMLWLLAIGFWAGLFYYGWKFLLSCFHA